MSFWEDLQAWTQAQFDALMLANAKRKKKWTADEINRLLRDRISKRLKAKDGTGIPSEFRRTPGRRGGDGVFLPAEHGWLAWPNLTPPYPLQIYNPYLLSQANSLVWTDDTAPAVPDIQPRKYSGLSRLFAQSMVLAKRAWADAIPASISTGGNALGIQRSPQGQYWAFNASAAQGVIAAKLIIPVEAAGYAATIRNPEATIANRRIAEARLFAIIECDPDAEAVELVSPSSYASSVTGGPLNGGWHWRYQSTYGATAGAIVSHLTQNYAFGVTGGFKSKVHRIAITWDDSDNPSATITADAEQKWLHARSLLHLWVGFGSAWNELVGTAGGNPSAETEYLESDAVIYARYDIDDAEMLVGINGLEEIEAGTVLPPGANESNMFHQYIKFCGGEGGGTVDQIVNQPKYSKHSWWDTENAYAAETVQGSARYVWSAAGGESSIVPVTPGSFGDSVNIVNCDGGTTHIGCDDADPYTNIQQVADIIATPGSWSKTTTVDYKQGTVGHLFFGDDVESVCIVEQDLSLVQNLLTTGRIEWLTNCGLVIDLYCGTGGAYSGRVEHVLCQIFGYDPPEVYACSRVSAVVESSTTESLHAETSNPRIQYRWPGAAYDIPAAPGWLDEFGGTSPIASAAPYMNTSAGGLAVTSDKIPPGLIPAAILGYGAWDGGV